MNRSFLFPVFERVYASVVSDWRRRLLSLPVGTVLLVLSTLSLGVRDEGLQGSPSLFVEDCSSVIGGHFSVVRDFDQLPLSDQFAIVASLDSTTPVMIKEL